MISDKASELKSTVNLMLRVIEETVPVQQIWVDTAENKETPRTEFSGENSDEIMEILKVAYGNLVSNRSFSPDGAKEHLLRTEPFQNFPELVNALGDHNHSD